MGLFKKKDTSDTINENMHGCVNNIKIELEEKEQEDLKEESKIEYVWVNGYKGMSENMICRDFQYEIGKAYSIDEDPKVCENGFHFCLDINHVFNYYQHNFQNRFFKVSGLVNKEEYDKYGTTERIDRGMFGFDYNFIDKLSAKEIKVIEEVSKEELFNLLKSEYDMIDNLEEFTTINDYKKFIMLKFIDKLKPYYSEGFSIILYDKIYEQYSVTKATSYGTRVNVDYSYLGSNLNKLMRKAIDLAKEGLSKDMCAYLLLCK